MPSTPIREPQGLEVWMVGSLAELGVARELLRSRFVEVSCSPARPADRTRYRRQGRYQLLFEGQAAPEESGAPLASRPQAAEVLESEDGPGLWPDPS